jgi:carboxymethylenebutenolidase
MAQQSPPTPQHTYLVQPPSPSDQGVLVLHAWWGLNPFMRRFCDRLAGEGLNVVAPDLYHGAVATTIPEAERLRSKLKGEVVQQEVAAASEHLQTLCHGLPVGVVGFSLGGYWALWRAQVSSGIAATVVFYATRGGDYGASRSAFQFHLAERDDYVAASGVKKLGQALRAAGREATFYNYPGTTHWFCEDDRPEAYHPEAAELAWRRMVEFLHQHVGSSENTC